MERFWIRRGDLVCNWSMTLGLAFAAMPGYAQGDLSPKAAKASITADAAKAIALKLASGEVLEVEKEKHNGESVYSVEIRSKDGIHEILLKTTDGSLIANKVRAAGDDADDEEDEDDD